MTKKAAGRFGRFSAALVGRYRIERQLGQGGMATVYLAEDLKHDRKVAVKVLRPELAAVLGALSDQRGQEETCVRPYPAGGPAIQVSASGGRSPLWSRDGRQLIYPDLAGRFLAVAVAPGPAFQAGGARPYLVGAKDFGYPILSWDVMADGSLLTVIPAPVPQQSDGATEVEVVLNFLSELKQRVGAGPGAPR